MSLVVYPVASDSRAFLPAAFSIALQTNQRAFASPFGGSEQVTDMLNDRWSCTLDLPPTEHNRAAKREAFVEAMRGQANHTELYHFGRPQPLGTAQSSAGLVIAAAQGAATLQIATAAGATLLAGDMLGVDGLLLRCAADCTANSNGLLTVPLTNRLRRAVPGLARASTATFIDDDGVVHTAGVNVPRYQGGQLLVEEARTNLLPRSIPDAPIPTGFTVGFGTGTFSTELVPGVGQLTGSQSLIKHTQSVLGRSYLSLGLNLAANTTYTVSVFFDKDNTLITSGASTVLAVAGLADATGVLSLDATQIVATGMYSITFITGPTSGGSIRFGVGTFGNATGAATFGAWQLELGSFPTSYIPTTTASVTRAADIVRPVTLDRPTAPFRLASTPAVRYVGGYAEGVTLDFVERVI
jgi:hypothetical protein